MKSHVEVMDGLMSAMDREKAQIAMLVAASKAAEAQDDDDALTQIQGRIDQKVAYLAFLRDQFDRRLN